MWVMKCQTRGFIQPFTASCNAVKGRAGADPGVQQEGGANAGAQQRPDLCCHLSLCDAACRRMVRALCGCVHFAARLALVLRVVAATVHGAWHTGRG